MGDGNGSRPDFPWVWLLPQLAVLAGLVVWGAAVYPGLPERVPQHIGPGGIDAWADKSVAAVFVPVLVYAGTAAVMTAASAAVLRVRPVNELAPGERASSLVNRPSTRASALRTARATLQLGFCIGLSIAVTCTVMWRAEPDPRAPAWLLPAVLAPIALGLVPVLAAAVRDRRDRRK